MLLSSLDKLRCNSACREEHEQSEKMVIPCGERRQHARHLPILYWILSLKEASSRYRWTDNKKPLILDLKEFLKDSHLVCGFIFMTSPHQSSQISVNADWHFRADSGTRKIYILQYFTFKSDVMGTLSFYPYPFRHSWRNFHCRSEASGEDL